MDSGTIWEPHRNRDSVKGGRIVFTTDQILAVIGKKLTDRKPIKESKFERKYRKSMRVSEDRDNFQSKIFH